MKKDIKLFAVFCGMALATFLFLREADADTPWGISRLAGSVHSQKDSVQGKQHARVGGCVGDPSQICAITTKDFKIYGHWVEYNDDQIPEELDSLLQITAQFSEVDLRSMEESLDQLQDVDFSAINQSLQDAFSEVDLRSMEESLDQLQDVDFSAINQSLQHALSQLEIRLAQAQKAISTANLFMKDSLDLKKVFPLKLNDSLQHALSQLEIRLAQAQKAISTVNLFMKDSLDLKKIFPLKLNDSLGVKSYYYESHGKDGVIRFVHWGVKQDSKASR